MGLQRFCSSPPVPPSVLDTRHRREFIPRRPGRVNEEDLRHGNSTRDLGCVLSILTTASIYTLSQVTTKKRLQQPSPNSLQDSHRKRRTNHQPHNHPHTQNGGYNLNQGDRYPRRVLQPRRLTSNPYLSVLPSPHIPLRRPHFALHGPPPAQNPLRQHQCPLDLQTERDARPLIASPSCERTGCDRLCGDDAA